MPTKMLPWAMMGQSTITDGSGIVGKFENAFARLTGSGYALAMNNGTAKFNVITPIEDVDPWRSSGGMHHVDPNDWRNVTGLDLPGKIILWQEDTDVRAFSLVPKWRWQFPTGTLAYDVLLRVKNGKEHIFEVRVHEKGEDDWDVPAFLRRPRR